MLLTEKTTPVPGCWEYQGSAWLQGESGGPRERDLWVFLGVQLLPGPGWVGAVSPQVGSVWGLWCDSCCGVPREEVVRMGSVPRGAAVSPLPMGITRNCRVPVH